MALTDPGVTLVEHRRHRFVPLSDAKALTKASARSVEARGYGGPAEWSFALDPLELWPTMHHIGTVTEYWSRSTRLRILPVGLRGMASAKITFFGNL